jgi:hypothetical protein
MSKRGFVTVMAIAVAVVVVSGGLLASNMGFKLNKRLNGAGAGGAAVGENHITLPFVPRVNVADADNLLTDIEGGDTSLVNFVQRFDPLTNQRETWFGGKVGGVLFTIAPCESYFVTMGVGVSLDYTIVGSHDPSIQCTFNGAGVGGWASNENTYGIPYHTTAENAADLLGTIPDVAFVQRFDPIADQRETWFGGKIGGTNFSIEPGEGYFVQMNGGTTATILPEHF